MAQEEKAKAYDEALERARTYHKNTHLRNTLEALENIFPELKESEDEKIRKALINGFKDYKGWDEEWFDGITVRKAIAWLEKQGQDKEINNFDVLPGLYKCVHRMFDGTPDGKLLFEVGNIYKCLSKHDRAEFEVSYGHSVYLEDPVVCKHFIPFESQGRQETTDKVEPKFKVGDWIVHNERKNIIKVVNSTPLVYKVVDILGYHHTITDTAIENNYHLWTIQDAKDGDVLASEPINDYPSPFVAIYKSHDLDFFNSYCFIGFNGKFHKGNTRHTIEDIHPATKEQSELLFSKMKEASYEWDTEKKELSKIEDESENYKQQVMSEMTNLVKDYIRQKPTWSEEDERMLHTIIADFKGFIRDNTSTLESHFNECIDWLKSIKNKIVN